MADPEADPVEGGEGESTEDKAPEAAPVARIAIAPEAGDAELNAKQVAKAKELFSKYDVDNSDSVSKDELRNLLRELNLRLDDERYERYVERYWKEADTDVSGTISLDEFLVLYAKVFAPNSMYGAPLRTAAARGHVDVVKDLVARGCNPNTGDGKGWTAVHHAAEFGRLDVIKALQEVMGLDLDIDADDNYGWTPLFNAASNNFVEVLRHLIRSGASVAEVSVKGRNALHTAASAGHVEAVRALIAEGCEVNAQDEGGWTPLHCAVLHGHAAVVKTLADGGADLSAKDNCGYTVTRYADRRTQKALDEAAAEGAGGGGESKK